MLKLDLTNLKPYLSQCSSLVIADGLLLVVMPEKHYWQRIDHTGYETVIRSPVLEPFLSEDRLLLEVVEDAYGVVVKLNGKTIQRLTCRIEGNGISAGCVDYIQLLEDKTVLGVMESNKQRHTITTESQAVRELVLSSLANYLLVLVSGKDHTTELRMINKAVGYIQQNGGWVAGV